MSDNPDRKINKFYSQLSTYFKETSDVSENPASSIVRDKMSATKEGVWSWLLAVNEGSTSL
jgi:hypothetical protein